MLKKLETTGPTGKKLETSLRTIQDLPAKLNPNKDNSLLTNKLKKVPKLVISKQERDLILRAYFN